MSIPYYVEHEQLCNQCDAELYINYIVKEHDGDLFCDEYCLTEYLYETADKKDVELTNDRSYKNE